MKQINKSNLSQNSDDRELNWCVTCDASDRCDSCDWHDWEIKIVDIVILDQNVDILDNLC